jgi:hypothetical protein
MMSLEGGVGLEPMCRLAEVSRAGSYRFLQPRPAKKRWKCANAIQQIILEHRRC